MIIEVDESYSNLIKQLPLIPIRDGEHFKTAVDLMKFLNRPTQPLSRGARDYAEVLCSLIGQYEKGRLTQLPNLSPQQALKYLLTENNLNQSDIVHLVGHKSNLSAFLSGKRELSKNAARALAEFFKVSLAVFQPGGEFPEWLSVHTEFGDWGGPGMLIKLSGENITDDMVDEIVAVPGVKLLDLSSTLVTNKCLHKIAGMAKLHRLDLSGTGVDDEGIEILSNSGIRELMLRHTKITDQSLEYLSRMSALGILDLQKMSFDGSGFVHLEKTDSWVWLNGEPLSDQAVQSLAKHCPKKLSLYWGMSDRRAKFFASSRLHELCLYGDEITDLTVELLAEHPTLKKLWLGSKQITNKGVLCLKYSKQLEFVCLRSCPSVTKQTIAEIKSSLSAQVYGPGDPY